ncbi:hypothetical protein FOB63_002831 [Clavispora lusitaniae]|uniref:Uncharacterized protein n=1 Tax=Clavispora lusitaniae TaxID=36911 RepID=A0AA91T4C0_CLALS|nr:hypothetical protein E0198_003040 [Clavispora lusitaniae]KAF7582750.1 hypothetical protein FOB63_002831 [Clavispora lusitaniae]OVF11298.1 hypothetical protein A9F13_01g07909 [Clavispora lusitaniae]
MFSISEPRDFVDVLDLDIESEWNPHYESSPSSPMSEPESPKSLLYECAFCMMSHSPSQPCNVDEHEYSWNLPQSAEYQYSAPVYVEEKPSHASIIQSNYRKWLVSVTPR